jgi:hypothetical protein
MNKTTKAVEFLNTLKDAGCKVIVKHMRVPVNAKTNLPIPNQLITKKAGDGQMVSARGGRCEITVSPDPKRDKSIMIPTTTVYTNCYSTDNYSKKIALNITTGRLRKKLEEAVTGKS